MPVGFDGQFPSITRLEAGLEFSGGGILMGGRVSRPCRFRVRSP